MTTVDPRDAAGLLTVFDDAMARNRMARKLDTLEWAVKTTVRDILDSRVTRAVRAKVADTLGVDAGRVEVAGHQVVARHDGMVSIEDGGSILTRADAAEVFEWAAAVDRVLADRSTALSPNGSVSWDFEGEFLVARDRRGNLAVRFGTLDTTIDEAEESIAEHDGFNVPAREAAGFAAALRDMAAVAARTVRAYEPGFTRDYYDVRWPAGTPLGGRFKPIAAAITQWLNEGGDLEKMLSGYSDRQIADAAHTMGIGTPAGSTRHRVIAAMKRVAFASAEATQRENIASTGDRHTPPADTRRNLAGGGHIVRKPYERNIWREGAGADVPHPGWDVFDSRGQLLGSVPLPRDAVALVAAPDAPGTVAHLGHGITATRTGDGWTVTRPDGVKLGSFATVAEAKAAAKTANDQRLRQVGMDYGVRRPKVAPSMTLEGKTPRKLTAEQRLDAMYAAGRISLDDLRRAKGRAPAVQEQFDPGAAVAFARGLVLGGEIETLAASGDEGKLTAYLRRQTTPALAYAARVLGVSSMDSSSHALAVESILRHVMPAASKAKTTKAPVPSVAVLREQARQRRIPGASRMTKPQLVAALAAPPGETKAATSATTQRHRTGLLPKTAAQRALLDALDAAGWAPRRYTPYAITFTDPRSGEHPTPQYAREMGLWPEPTMQKLRTIQIVDGDDGSIVSVLSREAHAPWVRVEQRQLTYKAAMAYIADSPEWIAGGSEPGTLAKSAPDTLQQATPAPPRIDESVPLRGDPEGDNMYMHGDSLTMGLAQAYAQAGRNGSANRMMDLRRRATAKDGITPQQVVDELRAWRAQETDPAFQRRIDMAIAGIDAPMTPLPDLPANTPPEARRLIEDLHAIPYARKGNGARAAQGSVRGPSLVEQVAEVYRDAAAGRRGDDGRSSADRLRRILRQLVHESNEASFRIWALERRLDPVGESSGVATQRVPGIASPLTHELRAWERGQLGRSAVSAYTRDAQALLDALTLHPTANRHRVLVTSGRH